MSLQAWNGLDDFGKVVSKHGSFAAIFVIFRDSSGSCSRPAFAKNMPDFKLAVDKNNKATELALLRVCGTVQQNPHMRAFWASTISFFLAFLGWFALAPLALEVATSMGTCENQLYPPEDNPKRVAYLKYKSLKTGKAYCQYGKNDDTNPTDCNPVPQDILASGTADEKMQYRPGVLADCVCTPGTECKDIIANAGVAAVASTIFVRIALGTLLERFGPVNVQSGLMTFGAFWVAMAAAITAPASSLGAQERDESQTVSVLG